jgi:hypothetical protein
MYEHHSQPLLPLRNFVYRLFWHVLVALTAIMCALGIGILGYHCLEGLSWLDSFLNASMILGGMGPVNELHSPAAKLFAGFYALFSGLFFVGIVSIIIFPIAHRFLHILHLDDDGKKTRPPAIKLKQ